MPDVSVADATKIKTYASTRASQTVGSGECFDLVDAALKDAGANSAANYGKITPTGDYIWGRKISLQELRAGDAVQFKNFEVEITTTTKTTDTDGSWSEDTQTETNTRGAPNHSAIVASVGADGAITVYEQNIDGDRTVKERPLVLKAGTSSAVSKSGSSTTTVTTTIKIKGTVSLYRPETPKK
jgi:hypothetical protein